MEMVVVYSDSIGLTRIVLDDSGITCDGAFFFFTDGNGRDYKIPVTDVFSVTME